MCAVLNARQVGKLTPNQVYIGRYHPRRGSSKWGNPFKEGIHGSRDEVIEKFRAWIVQQPHLMAALPELRGKDLVCWCAPGRCHGEVLIELAAAIKDDTETEWFIADDRISSANIV
jgi:hypothetical protein